MLRTTIILVAALAACDSSSPPSPAPSAPTTTAVAPSAAKPLDPPAYAKSLIRQFGPKLKKELMAGMSAGGPIEAVAVCNEKAPEIASGIEVEKGWSIRRTSLKVRNPANAPDAWERQGLEKLEERKKAGAPMADLVISETVDGQFRFLAAIETQAMCLTCHGPDLPTDLAAAIDEKYPKDAARGFAAGDIRGAFSVRGKL